MMVWTWQLTERQWIPQQLPLGEEYALGDQARLWAIEPDGLLLFAKPAVAVNGQPALPLQPLADWDEIAIGLALWCVGFDAVPEREIFRTTDPPLHCARCCNPFLAGTRTIICPQCDAHYHDSETLPCWTYGPTCTRCQRPTGGTVWHPAPLHRSSRRHHHGHPPAAR